MISNTYAAAREAARVHPLRCIQNVGQRLSTDRSLPARLGDLPLTVVHLTHLA